MSERMTIFGINLANFFANARAVNFTPPAQEDRELDNRSPAGEPTRRETIISEIDSGIYLCGICTDPITFGSASRNSLWHCLSCHNVYHFRCVKDYCDSRGPRGWACPSCLAVQLSISHATCWCGKQRHTEQITNYRTNSCADVCGRRGMCLHGMLKSCTLDCHAGPCLYTCADSCPRQPVIAAVTPRALFAVTQRSSSRDPGTELGSLRSYVCLWAIFAVIYVLLGVALCFHVRWKTMPWRYPHYDPDADPEAIVVISIIIWLAIGLPVTMELMFLTGGYLAAVFHLDARGPRSKRKRYGKLGGSILLGVVFGGIGVLPFIWFYAGPKIAWYLQMRDSCNGLDTRIDMDDGQRFQAISITHSHPPRNFYVAAHVVPSTANSTAPFQYYHRLSGATGAIELAVDVDLQRQQWRLLRLSSADTANRWLAYDSKFLSSPTSPGQIPFPRFASFPTPHETLVHRGSFGPAGANMWISGLGSGHEVEIFNMYAFVMQYKQEPFLRVFAGPDTDSRSSAASAKESWHRRSPLWTQRPHALEHMRTAAFGYKRGDLTMCARAVEHPWQYVPLAIIAAHRDQLKEAGLRTKA
ncbi:hypothetical protein QTJ16_001486 [Diplocarpon rosae]|uniref:RING-type domain-containing protein n=1 Tax=Diplocarpon rosae TaxID=946125 RepID=A0AAD9WFL8_9HELO|nr:hypothetical protein QTJ16_001486 [Diplocarpon rosae]